jgi:DNA polymerase-3 subunit beta
MNISVLQENLAKAVSIATKAVESRPTLPVLSNLLLEAEDSRLRIAATNLQMSITVWIGAKVDQAGSITLPAKTFADLVNNLSKERVDIQLDASTSTVKVSCGSTKSNIKGIDADEFPPINHAETPDLLIDAKVLRDMINQTAFAAAREDNRPILTGVYTLIEGENITMAAADGFRLAVRNGRLNLAYDKKVELVIPARALMEVARVISDEDGEIGISLPSKRDLVSFHLPNVEISSQLLEGRFPDFAAIIPRSYISSSVIYREDFLRQCKRAEIFSRDNANSGRLVIKPARSAGEAGTLMIIGKSSERGDTDGVLDAHIEGEPLDVSFNIKYLIDVLNVIGEERVIFQSNGTEHPGVIRVEGREDFVHVIMPMSR